MNTNLSMLKNKSFFVALIISAVSLFSTSCGDGGGAINLKIPGIDGPTIELTENNLIVKASFEQEFVDVIHKLDVPKYSEAKVQIGPIFEPATSPTNPTKTGTYIHITVSLEDLLDEDGSIKAQEVQKLPGGRPLPGVASGALPGVALTLEKFRNITLYLGVDFFGVFVPYDINMESTIITARFNYKQVKAGTISAVGPDSNGDNAGFLLLLDMSKSAKKVLKKIIDDPDYLKRLKDMSDKAEKKNSKKRARLNT